MRVRTCTLLLACVSCAWGQPASVTLVDVRNGTDPRLLLPTQAAAGLLNRAAATTYVIQTDDDAAWASLLLSNTSFVNTTAVQLLTAAFGAFHALLYDDSDNGTVMLPAVVSLAGGLSLVPLPASLQSSFPAATVAFNAVGAWETPLASVAFAAAAVLNETTSLAFQDPLRLATGQLVDFIVSARLFVSYLNNSCFPGTPEHMLLQALVANSTWPRPVRVYGYNGMDVVFGGDLYEAETDCINVMGQIATAGTHNLAFWTHVQPFNASAPPGSPTGPMQQPPQPPVTYNASHTYVALVYGDMDNIDFVQSFGRQHMQERVALCNASAKCFPLTWTLSPNLLELSPAILRWYYDTAASTGGMDHFIMPPSGTLYSYPGQMPPEVQAAYAVDQNAQAALMDTRGAVHWEWVLTWDAAWSNYFPRFAGDAAATRAFFLNDVPWVIPILDMFLTNETYRIIGDANSTAPVVAFRPAFNWQLDGPSGGLPYNASVIADIISALPIGAVTYVYVIQNTDTGPLFDMVDALAPHVTLVGYEQLVSLALQQAAAAR